MDWDRVALPLLLALPVASQGANQSPVDAQAWLKTLPRDGGELAVQTKGGIALRLCALPAGGGIARNEKNEKNAKGARDAKGAKDSKDGPKLSNSDYVFVVTSLPRENFGLGAVGELYDMRRQMKEASGFLKPMLSDGAMPKWSSNPEPIQAWLQTRLFIWLLTGKLMLVAKYIAPGEFFAPGDAPGDGYTRQARFDLACESVLRCVGLPIPLGDWLRGGK